MMALPGWLAFASLVPLCVQPGPVVQKNGITLALCGGEGGAITVPLGRSPLPGEDDRHRCVKGCHAGSRNRKAFDPAQ